MADVRTWDNGGGDNLWSNATNWSDNTKPVAGDEAKFDATSVAHCQIDEAVIIAALTATAAYTGAGADDGHIENLGHDVTITGNVLLANKKVTLGDNCTWRLYGEIVDVEDLEGFYCDGSGNTDDSPTNRPHVRFSRTGTTTFSPATQTDWAGALDDVTIDAGTTIVTAGANWQQQYKHLVLNGTLNVADAAWAISYGRADLGPASRVTGGKGTAYGRFHVSCGTGVSTQKGIEIADGAVIDCHEFRVSDFQPGYHFTPYTYDVDLFVVQQAAGLTTDILEPESGIYIITGDFELENQHGTDTLELRNSTNNPNIQIGGDLIWDKQDAGTITWTKGTGTLTFNGSGAQDADFAGSTVENIVVNKSGGTLTFTAGWTADSFLAIAGTVDFNGQTIETVGDFIITKGAAIATGADAMDGVALTVGGFLSLNGTGAGLLDLRAGVGDPWTLDVTGKADVATATVANCDASGGTEIQALYSTEGSGNTNWNFMELRTAATTGIGQ